MKKAPLLLAAVAAAGLSLQAAPMSEKEIKQLNFFKNQQLAINGTKQVGGLTMVSINAQTPRGTQRISVFITPDKKHIIVGEGFVDATGEQIAVSLDMSGFAKQAAYTIGSGKKELYVFTDPQCPYCVQLEREVLSGLSKKEYKIHYFFYPLRQIHPDAEAMSLFVMSQKTAAEKAEALGAMIAGSKDYKNHKMDAQSKAILLKELQAQEKIADRLGVSGTPSVFDERGIKINPAILAGNKRR